MLTWLAAVVLATGLGLTAVTAVGGAVRDRGPLGRAVTGDDRPSESASGETPVPDARDRVVRRSFTGDYGTFDVACQGPYASGKNATAPSAGGWHVVRYEPGPDDDVEVVFESKTEVVVIEVFCNRGRPEIAELDRSRVGNDG